MSHKLRPLIAPFGESTTSPIRNRFAGAKPATPLSLQKAAPRHRKAILPADSV